MSAFDPPDPSLRAGAAVDLDPDAPVIIGVAFDTPTRAQEYLLAMSGLRNAGKLELKDAVVVAKNDDGKVSVTETIDPTPGRAAASGAMWTGLLGLVVGGPIGWLAGLGVGVIGSRYIEGDIVAWQPGEALPALPQVHQIARTVPGDTPDIANALLDAIASELLDPVGAISA